MCVSSGVKTFFFNLHSSTLPVKAWMEEKGMFLPWSADCLLWKTRETVDHVFIQCWDTIFFRDMLKRTVKKELYITLHSIRFLPLHKNEELLLDMLILWGLHSIWRSRMSVRYADVSPRKGHSTKNCFWNANPKARMGWYFGRPLNAKWVQWVPRSPRYFFLSIDGVCNIVVVM